MVKWERRSSYSPRTGTCMRPSPSARQPTWRRSKSNNSLHSVVSDDYRERDRWLRPEYQIYAHHNAITGQTSPPSVVTRQCWAIITHYTRQLQHKTIEITLGELFEQPAYPCSYPLFYRVTDSAPWRRFAGLENELISSCNLFDVRVMQICDYCLSTRTLSFLWSSCCWFVRIWYHYVRKRSGHVIVRDSETKE